MRSTDIHIEWNDSRDRTENMYLPSQVPVEEMSLSEARRGLCARAMGSTAACRSGCEPFPKKRTRKFAKKQNESLSFWGMLVQAARCVRRLASNCAGECHPNAECGRTEL